ncbi:hypothetical protein AMTRI_Chr03g52820 [Amborella trichopoda]
MVKAFGHIRFVRRSISETMLSSRKACYLVAKSFHYNRSSRMPRGNAQRTIFVHLIERKKIYVKINDQNSLVIFKGLRSILHYHKYLFLLLSYAPLLDICMPQILLQNYL